MILELIFNKKEKTFIFLLRSRRLIIRTTWTIYKLRADIRWEISVTSDTNKQKKIINKNVSYL